MSAIIKRVAQKYISGLSKKELTKITKPYVAKQDADMYDNRNAKFGKESYPQKKEQYVHRSKIIEEGYVHFTNVHHRQMVAYFHPWMKGYLEKVEKALWGAPPIFCKPSTEKEEEPEIDEAITEFWNEFRLQDALKKSWHKSQVHGICLYYPMYPDQFFEGYSGPPWYIYSSDELGEPVHHIQGHPVAWTPTHSNTEKTEPKDLFIRNGVFYDYKLSDDFTGEPFGIGIWDLLIDWIYTEDAVNTFDQRMGNGFLVLIVPGNTTDAQIDEYEEVMKNTRTEKGIVITGSVDEPVEVTWAGMAGMQVDFIAHLEKMEDLIAFNMGFPKRWIMGDAEGAMVSSGNDHQEVNVQLKNLFNEWTLYMKLILKFHGKIQNISDISIKPPFEMQLSEEEKVNIDQQKALTIASKTWLTINEQREADGKPPKEGGDELIQVQEQALAEKEVDNKTDETPQTKSDALNIFSDNSVGVNPLGQYFHLSPTTVSKIRAGIDRMNEPIFKTDELTIKCDAISLDQDIYEIQDVPLILPQSKEYKNLGYTAYRSKEEISRIFNDPKYPKQFRIGATLTDDHRSRVPLEVLNENTVGMATLTRLDEDGNVRGNIRYSLKEADRILGANNYIRQKTIANENIPTSVALYSKDRPGKEGMVESDLDIRSFVFTQNPRNKKAGL